MFPTEAVAVVAALVAVVGVLIQYLNARSWEARRWTRDARYPEYRQFLLAANSYFAALQRREKEPSSELRLQQLSGSDIVEYQRLMRASLAAIRLLGPDSVEQAAQMMNNTLYAWDKGAPVGSSGKILEGFDDFQAYYRHYRQRYLEAARLVFASRNISGT